MGFLCTISCHLQIITVWVLLYQSGCLVFLYFAWFPWLGPPVLCWITVGRSLSCSPSERKSFQLLAVKYDVGCGFAIYGPYYVEVLALYTHFVERFLSWMDVEFCQLLFQHLWRWSCGFARFVDVVDDVDGFSNVVPSLHPWDESHLVMVYDPLDVFFNVVW